MSTYIRSAYDEGLDEGASLGKRNNQIQVIQSMIEKNMPIQLIADIVKLSEEEVRVILKENSEKK